MPVVIESNIVVDNVESDWSKRWCGNYAECPTIGMWPVSYSYKLVVAIVCLTIHNTISTGQTSRYQQLE